MRYDIFGVLFKEEMEQKNINRSMAGIVSIFIVTFFFLAPGIRLKYDSFRAFITGSCLISIFLSSTWMLSKFRDRRLSIWLALPVSRKFFVYCYSAILFIKGTLLKVIPFAAPIVLYNITCKNISLYEGFHIILLFLLTGYACTLLGISIVLSAVNRHYLILSLLCLYIPGVLFFWNNIPALMVLLIINLIFCGWYFEYGARLLQPDGSKSKHIRFNFIKREFIRFLRDKVMLINHFAYSLFMLVFLINTVFSSKGAVHFVLFVLMMISLSSTSGILFSYEKDNYMLLKSLPVSFKALFISKYLFSLAINMPIYIASFIALTILNVPIPRGSAILVLSSSLLLSTFIKLYYDYKEPNFKWGHTKQLLENRRKYKMWAMVMAVCAAQVFLPYINILLVIIIEIFVTVILSILIYNGSIGASRAF